jgi:glycosyltransferase involved in cell wall biosynthesis
VSAQPRHPRAFFLYRESSLRREALAAPAGAPERYSLYGVDEIAAAGFDVGHNLDPEYTARRPSSAGGAVLDRMVRLGGGYSGDFQTVLAAQRGMAAADVVFSTVDTVGIPLALLARAGLVRTPVVYAAIGLPERIDQLRGGVARRLYKSAFRRLHTIVGYGWGEVAALRAWLGDDGSSVRFVPFGVDTDAFRPAPEAVLETDVVSIGADPRRDYVSLLALAHRHPEWSFTVVASRDHDPVLSRAPANVRVETDVPFQVARTHLAAARLVVLPVRDNSYSGATTVLLQAMASGKPVVVTRTAAIEEGYHLADGVNCRLVSPGSVGALEQAAGELLEDAPLAEALGTRARETVERHLSWDHYTRAIRDLLEAAAAPTTVRA